MDRQPGILELVGSIAGILAIRAANVALHPFRRRIERMVEIEWSPGQPPPELKYAGPSKLKWRHVLRCGRGHETTDKPSRKGGKVFCLRCLAEGHPMTPIGRT